MKGECIQTSTHSQIRTFDMGKQNTPQSGPRSRPLSRPYSTRASFQAWWANFFEHTQLHSSVTASTVHVTASAVSTGLTAQKSPFTIISLYIFGLPRPPQIILPLGWGRKIQSAVCVCVRLCQMFSLCHSMCNMMCAYKCNLFPIYIYNYETFHVFKLYIYLIYAYTNILD